MRIILIFFLVLLVIASNASNLKNVNGSLLEEHLSYFFQIPETWKVEEKKNYVFITEDSSNYIGLFFLYSPERSELTKKIDDLKIHIQKTYELINGKITPIGKITVAPWFGEIWHIEGPVTPKQVFYFLSWDPYGVMVISSPKLVQEADRILKTIQLKYQNQ